LPHDLRDEVVRAFKVTASLHFNRFDLDIIWQTAGRRELSQPLEIGNLV
jgi:hypothetical protein